MRKDVVFSGLAKIGISNIEIHDCYFNLLDNFSKKYKSYNMIATCRILEPVEIRSLMSSNELEGSLYETFGVSVIDRRNNIIQSSSYFPKTGRFNMRFISDDMHNPDKFMQGWFIDIPTVNVTVKNLDYRISFQKDFHRPPDSNLYLGLGLGNVRDGFVQGVSAEMWFGESFWQHAKCTKEDLLAQSWLYCEERPTHLYMRAWPEPFTSAEGEQGEIQRRLLDLIFGINAENPCGIER